MRVPAGETLFTLRIPIIDDERPERSGATAQGFQLWVLPRDVPDGQPASFYHLVGINDNDGDIGLSTTPTLYEGQTKTITVERISPETWGHTSLPGRLPRYRFFSGGTATHVDDCAGVEDYNSAGTDICINSVDWDYIGRTFSIQFTALRDRETEGKETVTFRLDSRDRNERYDFEITITDQPSEYVRSGSREAGNFRCRVPIPQPHDVFPGKTNVDLTDAEIRQWMAEVNRQGRRSYALPEGLVADWDKDSYEVGEKATIRFRTADGEPSCASIYFTINLGSQPGFWEQNPPITAYWQTEYNARILVPLYRGDSEATMSVPVEAPGTASFRVLGVWSPYGWGSRPTPVDGDGNALEPHVEATARVCTGTCPSMGEVPLPAVRIAGAFSGSEGDQAGFTLQADPAPPAGETLEVDVTVTAEGDFGVETGSRKVTIGSDGYAELLLETTGDDVDEPDGSVTLTIEPRAGHYTLGVPARVTTGIVDDDDTVDGLTDGNEPNDNALPAAHPVMKYASLVKSFYDRITARHQHGDSASGGWNKRFLKAMGHPEYVDYPQAAVTVQDATRLWNHGGPGANTAWNGTVEAVTYAEEYFAGQITPPDPVPVPAVSIAAGADVTEGGSASFVLTAPATRSARPPPGRSPSRTTTCRRPWSRSRRTQRPLPRVGTRSSR